MQVGTVGTGAIVRSFLTALGAVNGPERPAQCAAVFSRSLDTADALADEFGVAARFTDRREFLASPLFDTLYVASPNHLHFAWCRDALLAGKHVICEKPFTAAESQARMLAELAREKGLMLFEASMVPWLPEYAQVRRLLPRIGRLRLVQLNYSQYSSRYDAFLAGNVANVFSPECAGGALMDLNSYHFTLLTDLFGPAGSVCYRPNRAPNGVDLSGTAILQYSDFVAAATAAKDCDGENGVVLQGEAGRIIVSGAANRPTSVVLKLRDGTAEEYPAPGQADQAACMAPECAAFVDAVNTLDLDARDRAMARTLAVQRLLELARTDGGLLF